MPVNFNDFYNYATNGNFSRGSAVVLSEGTTSKFNVSGSDHSWALTRSGDDKKLNNDIRNAFYKAVSEQCKGNIPKSVLSAMNLGDYKLTNGNATSGKPLTAYRMNQVFTAMRQAGVEMPKINMDEEPIVIQDDHSENLVQEDIVIQNNDSSSKIIINLNENNDSQIKINDIALEKSPEQVQNKEENKESEQVQNEEPKKKPSYTREEKLLHVYLGHHKIQDILKSIPKAAQEEVKSKIEAALHAKKNVEDELIGVVRHINTVKFWYMLENDEKEIWTNIESFLLNEYQNKAEETNKLEKLAVKVAHDFESKWLAKDSIHANKPMTMTGLSEQFIMYLEENGPQYVQEFQLENKMNWREDQEFAFG